MLYAILFVVILYVHTYLLLSCFRLKSRILICSQVDSNMKEILSVNPLELWFPMKAQEEFSCSMLLKNKTHHYVAYKINAQKLNIYRIEPCSGLISPQFTCNISVRMQAQQGVSPNMQLMDRILVQSVVVSDDLIDIAKDLSCKQKGKLVLKGPDKIMSKVSTLCKQ